MPQSSALPGVRLPRNYERDFHDLTRLAGQVNRLMADGSFYRYSFVQRYRFVRRLTRLYRRLVGPVSDLRLRHVLAASAVLVAAASCAGWRNKAPTVTIEVTQTTLSSGEVAVFTAVVTDADTGDTHSYQWFVDDDAEPGATTETFSFSGSPAQRTVYVIRVDVSDGFETATASVNVTVAAAGPPMFATPVANPFGLPAAPGQGFAPAIADLDADGDLDVLAGGDYATLLFYENTGSSTSPAFADPVINPFGFTEPAGYAFPALADLDADGDQDLLVGEVGMPANLLYYQNTGSASAPAFGTPLTNPFGIVPGSYYFATPALADLDGDGDYDLVAGEYGYANLRFYENTGTPQSPAFAPPQANPLGLTATTYVSFPAFADADGDGDQDLLVGEYGDLLAGFQYFENTGTDSAPAFADAVANPFGLTAVATGFALPAFADLDNDGDQDLLVGSWYGGDTWYFENTRP